MEECIYGFIYCITFPNGKKYIGQTTKEIEERINEHICVSKTDAQYLLSKAIRKYGENTIVYEAIDIAHDRDELNVLEIEYILFYNTHYLKGNGYNMTDGGEGVVGYRHTEESKRIMSEKSKLYFSDASIRIAKSIEVKKYFENPENKLRLSNQIKSYYINNPEAKENMSIRMTEYFSNPENRLKQSKKLQEYFENNPEARQLLSNNSKKYYSNPENREIMSNIKKEFYKNNPDIAKEHSEKMKEIHKNNPEIAKKHSERMKDYYSNPDIKLKLEEQKIKTLHRKVMKQLLTRKTELQKKIRGLPKPFNVYYEENLIGRFDYVPFAIDYLQKNRNITISGRCIRRVLYGERNHTHGYKFKYIS
jgi:group I intron endonuclease